MFREMMLLVFFIFCVLTLAIWNSAYRSFQGFGMIPGQSGPIPFEEPFRKPRTRIRIRPNARRQREQYC